MKVNVSTLSEHEFCPRAVYLKHVLKLRPQITVGQARGLVGHALRKELSLRQAKLLKMVRDESQVDSLIQEEFIKIMADLPCIYKEKLSGVDLNAILPEIRREMEVEVELFSKKLSTLVREYGLAGALRMVTPLKVEFSVSSDAIGFSGIVDKLVSPMTPVEIKTGKTGEGVWGGDRLQVCAYGMLLEEKFSQEILYGLVEYTRVQEQRQVLFTERLRRRVIETRDSIREILSGFMPEICPHGSGRKCDSCSLKEACYAT